MWCSGRMGGPISLSLSSSSTSIIGGFSLETLQNKASLLYKLNKKFESKLVESFSKKIIEV